MFRSSKKEVKVDSVRFRKNVTVVMVALLSLVVKKVTIVQRLKLVITITPSVGFNC